MGARFKVSTCEGYLTEYGDHGAIEPGLSAHVLDTLLCHRVVGTFRSETRLPAWNPKGGYRHGPIQGREGAVRAAERLAGFLNAHDA
jgi:hypothetical protein